MEPAETRHELAKAMNYLAMHTRIVQRLSVGCIIAQDDCNAKLIWSELSTLRANLYSTIQIVMGSYQLQQRDVGEGGRELGVAVVAKVYQVEETCVC